MKKRLLSVAFAILLLFSNLLYAQNSGDLELYIQRLKDDKAGPLKETGYLSAGSDFLYAQEHYEAKNYTSAEWYFSQALKKQTDNAFTNYQLALSLIRQNDQVKRQQAQQYLKAAFALNAKLEDRYAKDMQGEKPQSETDPEKKTRLDSYIANLKKSAVSGGAETALGTAGYEAYYGIGYFDANKFDRAQTSFSLSLSRDPNNPYVNYLLAVSMAAQSKPEATMYYKKALEKDSSLGLTFDKDVANAKSNWQKMDTKPTNVSTSVKTPNGGALIPGEYTCHQSVWNGPNKSPAYSFQYKGYFTIKSNGTYSWLDNGGTGKFSYDAKSGSIAWLTGYLKKSGVKSSYYKLNQETAQITLKFSESNSWECGCKK